MSHDEDDLRHRLAASEAECVRLRHALASSRTISDALRIGDEVAGHDGGINPFAAAVRATRMPMAISDPRQPDNPIVFVNDAFCRLSGYPRDEIIGRNCRFLQGPETDRATSARVGAAIRACEPIRADLLNYRKNGEMFWNRLLVAPVLNAGGDVAYFFASQVDVTDERDRLQGLQTHNAALAAEVSDRRHELEETARRLQFATDSARLGIWELDLRTGDLNSSATFKANHGRATDRHLSYIDLKDTVHPEDRAMRDSAIQRSVTEFVDLDVEYRVVVSLAVVRWVQVRAQVERSSDGKARRIAGVSLDVTDRRAADLRRRAMVDLSDRIRDLNDPADLAYAAAEILGRALGVDQVGHGTVDPVTETITIEREWRLSDTHSLAGVHRFRDFGSYVEDLKRGDLVTFSDARTDPRTFRNAEALEAIGARALLNLPVFERSGFAALLYMHQAVTREWTDAEITLVRDIAERVQVAIQRRRAERDLRRLAEDLERQVQARTRELRESEARFRGNFEASPDYLHLWRVRTDDSIVFDALNPAASRRFDQRPEDVVGLPPHEVFDAETARTVERVARECCRMRSVVRYEATRTLNSPVPFTLSVWAVPLGVNEDGERTVLFCGRDITEQRQAEEALRQSQKMEAVGQLTGGVAHDFNNLLTVIRSSVDLLKRSDLREERRMRYIEAISDTTTRATKLTAQLLAFARRQTLKPEIFDVNASAEALVDMISTLTGSRITTKINISKLTAAVNADRSQFDTALVNMTVNARDAMAGSGQLTIATGRAKVIPPRRSHAATPGEFVTVSVSDTGNGIRPIDIDRVFEPFFTTKGVGHGTGLGLSQAIGFAKQSGGDVIVVSEVGVGTTFTLYLPHVDEAQMQIAAGAEEEADAAGGYGLRVLLVEDNVDVGGFAVQALEELGYVVVWATDADMALAALTSQSGAFDVVFSDVIMPGMNGVELAREITRRYPAMPVVLTSGYSEVLVEEGTHGFQLLQKPYSVELLSRTLWKAAKSQPH